MSLTEVRALPAWEVESWRAYVSHEPLPDLYWATAQICQVLVNINRAKGKPARVEDFIPRVHPARARQTPEEMLAVFRAATDHLKG